MLDQASHSQLPMPQDKENHEKLIRAAIAYLGKLQHIQSNSTFISNIPCVNTYANDFMLMFGDKIGNIPSAVKKAVLEQHNRTRSRNPQTYLNTTQKDNLELHMNCWEFCFLALYDAGLVTHELLSDLCYILHASNMNRDKEQPLVRALYKDPLEDYKKVSGKHLPNPGDILLFVRENEDVPWHAAICIDEQGAFIDLLGGSTRKRNISKLSATLYLIPLDNVVDNIKHFIGSHKNIQDPPEKITEEALLLELKKTQHRNLLKFDDEKKLKQVNDERAKKQNELYGSLMKAKSQAEKFVKNNQKLSQDIIEGVNQLITTLSDFIGASFEDNVPFLQPNVYDRKLAAIIAIFDTYTHANGIPQLSDISQNIKRIISRNGVQNCCMSQPAIQPLGTNRYSTFSPSQPSNQQKRSNPKLDSKTEKLAEKKDHATMQPNTISL